MADAKKYYWLKLKDDFFTQPKIKKLRRIAGGDTYTIIYLKMQLLSLKNNGVLTFQKIEPSFAEELALIIDEDEDNVNVTLQYLVSQGLIESNDADFLLTEAVESIGTESKAAERVRRFREKDKAKALQCNADVTQCNADVTACNADETKCNTEIRDKREEIRDRDKREEIELEGVVGGDQEDGRKRPCPTRFQKPTIEEIQAYCRERENNVDVVKFFNHYEAVGWHIGKAPMKNWRACVITWERTDSKQRHPPKKDNSADALREALNAVRGQ